MEGKKNLQNNFRIMLLGLQNAIKEYLEHGCYTGKIDEVEAYLVASIHALMDYADRFLENDERILACRYVNNTIKHAGGFVTHKEITGGLTFPMFFPSEFKKIKFIWKNNADLECRYINQKEAYIHYFAGKELLETLNPLADMIENGIENKLCE